MPQGNPRQHFGIRRLLSFADGFVAGAALVLLLFFAVLWFIPRLDFDGMWPGLLIGIGLILCGGVGGALLMLGRARKRVNGYILYPSLRAFCLVVIVAGPWVSGRVTRDEGPDPSEIAIEAFEELYKAAEQKMKAVQESIKSFHAIIAEGVRDDSPAARDLAWQHFMEFPKHSGQTDKYQNEMPNRKAYFLASPDTGNEHWEWIAVKLPNYCDSLIININKQVESLRGLIDAPVPPGVKAFDRRPIYHQLQRLFAEANRLSELVPLARAKEMEPLVEAIRVLSQEGVTLSQKVTNLMVEAEKAYESSGETEIAAFESIRDTSLPEVAAMRGRIEGQRDAWEKQIANAPAPLKPVAMDLEAYQKARITCRELWLQAEMLRESAARQSRTPIEQDIAQKLTAWTGLLNNLEEEVKTQEKAWIDSDKKSQVAVDFVTRQAPLRLEEQAALWRQDVDRWMKELETITVTDEGAPRWLAIFLPHAALADAMFGLGIFGPSDRTEAREIADAIASGMLPREGVLEELIGRAKTPAQKLALVRAYEQLLEGNPMTPADRATLRRRLNDIKTGAVTAMSTQARKIYNAINSNPETTCDALKQLLDGVDNTFTDSTVKGEVEKVIQALGEPAISKHWLGCLADVEVRDKDE